jgi:hypothetical protein
VWARVQASPSLQAFIRNVEAETADAIENVIIEAAKGGDLATARWWADRKMRDRGYGPPRAETIDAPPPDPQLDDKRRQVVERIMADLEERARARLSPSSSGQKLLVGGNRS